MKKVKKIVAIALYLCVMLSLFAMTASAKYYSFSFDVTPGSNSGVAYSSVNPKDDNDEYAHVYKSKSDVIGGVVFYFQVVATAAKNREACSSYYRYTGASYTPIKYYNGYAWQGAQRCLKADTDKYRVMISGNWYS